MVMVLEQKDPWEQFGASFGAAASKSLQDQYKQFQERKRQQMEAEAIDQLAGDISGEQDPMALIQAIAKAPVSDQTKAMYIQGIQQREAQRAQQMAFKQQQSFLAGLPMEGEEQQQGLPSQEMTATEEVTQEDLAPSGLTPEQDMKQADKIMRSKTIIKKAPSMIPQNVQQELQKPVPERNIDYDKLSDSQLAMLSKLSPELSKVMERKERFSLEDRKMKAEDFRESFKFNKEYIDEVYQKARGADTAIQLVDQMQRLQDTGKLAGPLKYKFFKTLGAEFLLSPESQAFNNLIVQFTKDIKNYYGARISAFELDTFMKSIPTLNNTAEGRSEIIKIMRSIEEGKRAKENIMTEAIKRSEKTGEPLSRSFQGDIDDLARQQLEATSELINRQIQSALDRSGINTEMLQSDKIKQAQANMKEGDTLWVTPDGRYTYNLGPEDAKKFVAAGGIKFDTKYKEQ